MFGSKDDNDYTLYFSLVMWLPAEVWHGDLPVGCQFCMDQCNIVKREFKIELKSKIVQQRTSLCTGGFVKTFEICDIM